MRTSTWIAAAVAWASVVTIAVRAEAGHFVMRNGAVIDGDVIAEDGQSVTVQISSPIATITRRLSKTAIASESRAADEAGAAESHRQASAAAAAANLQQVEAARQAGWQKHGQQIIDLEQRIARLRATQDTDAATERDLHGEFDKEIELIDAEYQQEYLNEYGVLVLSAVEQDKLSAIAVDQKAYFEKVAELHAEGAAAGAEADRLGELRDRLESIAEEGQ
jgi:hypothetical protein